MSKFDRSNLLKFLRKPRCLREIVRHFEVPTKLVDYHLHKAMKSGEVLLYIKEMPPGSRSSNAKQIQLKGILYLSKNGALPSKHFAAINSLPKTRSSAAKESTYRNHKGAALPSRKLVSNKDPMTGLKLGRAELSGVLHNPSAKMKLAKSNKSTRRLEFKKRVRSDSKSLLYVEKICLFRALLNQPLPFLDIHNRFGISKRTVMGLVRRGFLEEEWGPKDVGVRFGLTEKGKSYLEELEVAARFEPKLREGMFIRLKHRIFP